MSPLILATKKKSEQLLNVLIHAGADVDTQSKDVLSILAMFWLVLKKFYDHNCWYIQKEEMTALMFAVKVGSLDVVKLLMEKNADLFALNSVTTTEWG